MTYEAARRLHGDAAVLINTTSRHVSGGGRTALWTRRISPVWRG